MPEFLKTKFYPVDYDRHIIYIDPQDRERDCSFGERYSTLRTHSEADSYVNPRRRYTVRQLQIDGSISDLSGLFQYSTRLAAERAIRAYLQHGTPFSVKAEA